MRDFFADLLILISGILAGLAFSVIAIMGFAPPC